MTGLLALALVAGGVVAEPPPPFIEASNCGSLFCAWVIGVSPDGLVTVEIPKAPHAGRKYRLSPRAFAHFRAAVVRERPLELSGSLGDLRVDGPQRTIRVAEGSQTTSIRLYSTPPGFERLYRSDSSGLARALRVCEAVRQLGGADLASCVDVR
jgi:hypothetical protein